MRKKRAKPVAKRQAGKRRTRQGGRAQAMELALASLAHEVRTPLNGILALSELLAASGLPERERSWAVAVKSAAEHLAQLTTAVVDGVKADKHKLVLKREPFHLRRLVDAVAAALRARAETKGLGAAVSVADDLPATVVGDPMRLRAALENLIDNAVKFTESGQVALDVSARAAPRGGIRLLFAVEDSGIGLSPAEIRRLLRPFAQASPSVARRFGGAGLGLVFVRRIAKAMGGNLTVASAPGRGCRFGFEISVRAQPPCDGERNAVADRATVATRSLRVLCAEDNPYGRVVLNTILTELGHRPDFVGTGEAAVEAIGRSDYDVILMDINLPGLDGMAATRIIRRQTQGGARVPIYGISGRSERDAQAAARAAGMTGYIAKPVSPAAIASLLNGVAAG
jgi:CheY-like chemotaxis protein/nitrogen-specific signal transduction histidine kinase